MYIIIYSVCISFCKISKLKYKVTTDPFNHMTISHPFHIKNNFSSKLTF